MTYQIYGSKMANNQQEVISSHRCAISISSVPKLGDLEVPPRLPSAADLRLRMVFLMHIFAVLFPGQ